MSWEKFDCQPIESIACIIFRTGFITFLFNECKQSSHKMFAGIHWIVIVA